MKKIIGNPIFIYGLWILLVAGNYFRILLTGSLDYEDEVKEVFNIHILVASLGVLCIGVLTVIFRRDWYKKFYFIPLTIPIGVVPWIAYTILR